MEGKGIAIAIVLLGMLMCSSVKGETGKGLCFFSSIHECFDVCSSECGTMMHPIVTTCESLCALTCSPCSHSTEAPPPSPDAENVIEQWTSPASAPSADDDLLF
ncbi:hypothetical protein ACFE04_017592 [Oxalis oulophora]